MEKRNLTCIGCPMGCALLVEMNGKEIISVTGNTCKKGAEYAVKEVTNPTRIVTTTVRVKNGSMPVVSVKTAQDIPNVILENAAGTGVDIVATGNVKQIIQ